MIPPAPEDVGTRVRFGPFTAEEQLEQLGGDAVVSSDNPKISGQLFHPKIRNGKSAISADSATWLAIAQPSSSLKCPKASDTTAHVGRKPATRSMRPQS